MKPDIAVRVQGVVVFLPATLPFLIHRGIYCATCRGCGRCPMNVYPMAVVAMTSHQAFYIARRVFREHSPARSIYGTEASPEIYEEILRESEEFVAKYVLDHNFDIHALLAPYQED